MYASESWKNKVHDIERLESVDDADQVNVWGNTEWVEGRWGTLTGAVYSKCTWKIGLIWFKSIVLNLWFQSTKKIINTSFIQLSFESFKILWILCYIALNHNSHSCISLFIH